MGPEPEAPGLEAPELEPELPELESEALEPEPPELEPEPPELEPELLGAEEPEAAWMPNFSSISFTSSSPSWKKAVS